MREWKWDKGQQWARLQRASQERLRQLRRQAVLSKSFEIAWQCLELVAQRHKCRFGHLIGHSRKHSVIFARYLAIHLIRQHTFLSQEQIGFIFGRNRSTIASLLARFEIMLDRSPVLQFEFDELSKELSKAIATDPPRLTG